MVHTLAPKVHNSRVLADWLADCAERAWSSRLGEGRHFGAWLQTQPNLLQSALQNEQLAPLCFSLTLIVDLIALIFSGVTGFKEY